MKKHSVLRYWIQQQPFTTSQLVDQTGFPYQRVTKFIALELSAGNIQRRARVPNNHNGSCWEYEWCGKPTVEGMLVKTLLYLRDTVATKEAKAMANEMFRAMESLQ